MFFFFYTHTLLFSRFYFAVIHTSNSERLERFRDNGKKNLVQTKAKIQIIRK